MKTNGTNEAIYQQHALTPREAARYLRVSEAVLRLWRSRGEGPQYYRAGEKLVRYRRADLDAWVTSRLSEETKGKMAPEQHESARVSPLLTERGPQAMVRNH